MSYEAFEQKKKQLLEDFRAARMSGSVGLGKTTSNLFRHREQKNVKKIDVRGFTEVLNIDVKNGIADVEGMITFEKLVDATLEHGMLPHVVPELKSITLGGGVVGGAIESSSFKYGLVHETITEMEILTGTGDIVVCSPTENSDLFYGFASTYGTLGYALRIKVRLYPAKKYVKLTHHKYTDQKEFFKDLELFCEQNDLAFVDGTVFSEKELYITLGEFVDSARFVSNYKWMKVYYKSIREKSVDYLTAKDYIWRWDTDWFWCSKNLGFQNPLMRLLFPWALNSIFYWKVMRWNRKYKIVERLPGERTPKESVIQDVQIPLEGCNEFLSFFHKRIGILPVWICPTRQPDPKAKWPLYAMKPNKLYVNFGFWDTVPTLKKEGFYNRLVERKVSKLNGKKGLYSDAYYTEKEFWEEFDKKAFLKLKKKWDPDGTFKDLYEKCVQRK